MKVLLQKGRLVVIPETDLEETEMAVWKLEHEDHVFAGGGRGRGLALHDLGPREHACNEPLNVISNSPDPAARLISNFAATPFELDGQLYQSVESFWQGLKFDTDPERRGVAALDGPAARNAGEEQGYGPTVTYDGRTILVGTWEHWQLMRRACEAKFAQNFEARAALLATGVRPLVHRVRRDSKTIPGAIMCDIWMEIRRKLREQIPGGRPVPAEAAKEES